MVHIVLQILYLQYIILDDSRSHYSMQLFKTLKLSYEIGSLYVFEVQYLYLSYKVIWSAFEVLRLAQRIQKQELGSKELQTSLLDWLKVVCESHQKTSILYLTNSLYCCPKISVHKQLLPELHNSLLPIVRLFTSRVGFAILVYFGVGKAIKAHNSQIKR